MKKAEKIYVGNGVEKFYGDMVSVSVNLTKLGKEAKDFMFEYNGDKFVKLNVCKNRDGENEYGKTHSIRINDFEPDSNKGKDSKDLPF